MRITTDIDLQNLRKLGAVTGYIDKKLAKEASSPSEGWEIWLHDQGVMREDVAPVRCWVNHAERALGPWPPPSNGSIEIANQTSDGRLDLEYKYWAFMESHPAHVPLPANAYSEALDVLTWSYTDRLLKTHRRAPPPFTQHESHELIEVLRATSGSESPLQAAVQTKIVARILRRIVQWKQHYHLEKSLPHGAAAGASSRGSRGVSYGRRFTDFVLAWLCFGIPYLYANRHMYQRYDEESGLMRSAGPMIVVGASVCIAAIVLTAAVTFLALPGLDSTARTAGLVAIVGAAASLGTTLIAAFRRSFEIQRMAPRGGEGLVVTMSTLSGGSVLLSLPAVFLAYSIIAFLAGVVLYVFRGTVIVDPSHWTKFASYTKWTTVGGLAFVGGVLITSMFVVRH
ncbi:hypothetical protein DFH11DRAFT_1691860 [Phellopilus nigrolimitatus]|nr:hypothetical protein DFH11DRAFT_1691860 [Phellopilus nigrolimitatus]